MHQAFKTPLVNCLLTNFTNLWISLAITTYWVLSKCLTLTLQNQLLPHQPLKVLIWLLFARKQKFTKPYLSGLKIIVFPILSVLATHSLFHARITHKLTI